MVSREKLVLLYKETQDPKNKQKLFTTLFEGLKAEAMSVGMFYATSLFKVCKDDFFEDTMQEAQIVLLKCIDTYDCRKGAKFNTFYHDCLNKHLFNLARAVNKPCSKEIPHSQVIDWQGEESITNDINDKKTAEDISDNNSLRGILDLAISQITFDSEQHKNIFKDYIGFSDNKITYNYSYIGKRYNLTRAGIRKICNKYMSILKNILTETGDIERLKQFL